MRVIILPRVRNILFKYKMKIYAELIRNYKNIRIKSLIDNKYGAKWAIKN